MPSLSAARFARGFLIAAALWGLGAPARAATIYVDDSNTSGTQDGTQQFPFVSIRNAINGAAANDVVSVAPGLYREFLVMRSGVHVECQVPPSCVIDATGKKTTAVLFDRTTNGPRLEGFRITGGTGYVLGEIADGTDIRMGGGIRIIGSSPIVRNNLISGNVMTEGVVRGAGIAVTGQSQNPQIIGNTIADNVALSEDHPQDSEGGGIYVSTRTSQVVITDNVIERNTAWRGGGVWAFDQDDSTISLLRNIVQDNEARQGAGVFSREPFFGSTTIANNVFVVNGTASGTLDCDDASAGRSPNHSETCGDGIDNDCNPATPDTFDTDGDGFACNVDCNDANPAIRPGAVELCNDGVDNNCNGQTDAQEAAACGCGDPDGDGASCGDCNNSNPAVRPGLPEACNDGLDNDCNAATPDVFDGDADGANCALDCLDTNNAVHPGASEAYCNGLDDDCNNLTPDVVDLDADLWDCTLDCQDQNIAVNPAVIEFCFDDIDNNCNDLTDQADPECICGNPVDLDGDGWRCLDCNDQSAMANPSRSEICDDGLDNDCDPETLDIFDADGDGFDCDVDCNDANPAIRPSAGEHCGDGIDNDCDGATDAPDPDCACADGDLDGYRCDDCNDASSAIRPGRSEVCNNGINDDCDAGTPDLLDQDQDGFNCVADCDDLRPDVYPLAGEQCEDFRDNDCDGLIDVPRTELVLVTFGSSMSYLANASNPGIGMTWTADTFDDSTWLNGVYGVGYQMGGGGANDLIATDVPVGTTSIYTRARFEIVDPAGVNQLRLAADWDDGYVAWVNGVEVYRSPEVPGVLLNWNTPVAGHEASNGQVPSFGTPINISVLGIPALKKGTNVLAVGIWNSGGGSSSDLVVVPRLVMDYGDNDPGCACADTDNDAYRCDDCNNLNPNIHPGAAELGCNGVNEDCSSATPDVLDKDGDGYLCNVDCNDSSQFVRPGAVELPCNGLNDDCNANTADVFDVDGDTFVCSVDCDETNTAINPSAPEIACDAIDNDCNGQTSDRIDFDKDGFLCNQECNDANAAIHPNRIEKCNDGIDNNCNNLTDLADAECGCPDGDGDGYRCSDCSDGNAAVFPNRNEVCNDTVDNDCNPATQDVGDADGDGVNCLTDCNDANPFVRPTTVEACSNGVDDDCNAATPDVFDNDGDGYLCNVDCRDDVATIRPGVPEVCNDGVDNDCNLTTIDLFDADNDGSSCAFDCNDADQAIHPDAVEACNDGKNNDCNAATPDVFDNDGDGSNCTVDCHDGNPAIAPTAAEHCSDGIDNDCDGRIDSINPQDSDCQGCNDSDGDGYRCDDCNDANQNVRPNAPEVCNNGINDDCNAATPDIRDADGDTFACNVDCDDANPAVYPGAPELCLDGVDNDCNPGTPPTFDADGDGSNCSFDCNDANPQVRPGLPEVSCNGVNDDCSASTLDLRDADGDGVTCADASVFGGGVAVEGGAEGQFTIVNNTFVGNALDRGTGGAAHVDDLDAFVTSRGIVANNVFYGNSARVGGGVDHTLFFGQLAQNSLYQNTGGDLYNSGASTASQSGNTFVDPRFAGAAFGNYRLAANSPLIDTALVALAPLNDADAVPRPYDGDGNGSAVADVGAYEFPSGEVFGLVFVNKTSLSWTVAPGDELFNLYRGSMLRLRAIGHYTQDPEVTSNAAQFCHIPPAALPYSDSFTPTVVDMVFYLVTRIDFRQTYEGTLGQRSNGALRFNSIPCP